MKIINYSYKKRGNLEFVFDVWPHSKVMFSPIRNYYFVRYVRWDERDPVVSREDLQKMEQLVNRQMGREIWYDKRKGPGDD
ncbi:hypothetical protein GJU40_13240 [Bacillus lacus]|uniref:Uncharacterized protein n=1 Tax=Metabacillus lacus TaxID=1983721 RepID=A0A7X2J0Z1_9BACI|nr:hypothetical protein [Metabacillus lacus]MRX73107.1 hypothetical protein [Metabacillus lacus]